MHKLKMKIAALAKGGLGFFGYGLVPVSLSKPISLLSFDGNPRSLRYMKKNRDYVITGWMKDGRSLFVLPLQGEDLHPFVEAAKEAIDVALVGGDEREAIRRRLMDFYSCYQPGSAAEVLGASAEEMPMLGEQPPWVVIKPWEDMTVIERMQKMTQHEKEDNGQIVGSGISIEHGCNFCGPVSNEKLNIEVERIYRLVRSMRKNGFKRDDSYDGDIRADVLIDSSGEWRWLVKSGQHRAAVLSAMGFASVPIRVHAIVCRDEVDCWPQVLAGNCSREVGLKIFDNIFMGVSEIAMAGRSSQGEAA